MSTMKPNLDEYRLKSILKKTPHRGFYNYQRWW